MSPVDQWLASPRTLPLVAILRGLPPLQAIGVGQTLAACGYRMLEVPLNRPGALQCIEILRKELPSHVLVGAGTVLSEADVDNVFAAGGRLVVAPNFHAPVVERAVELGMLCVPGVATPTEAFAALRAGAHALKLFPAEMVGHGGLKAMRSVLPPHTDLWPVGGITPDGIAGWVRAGATGFGIGSQLYAPGDDEHRLHAKANAFRQAWELRSSQAGSAEP